MYGNRGCCNTPEAGSETEGESGEEIQDTCGGICGLVLKSDVIAAARHPCGGKSGGEIAHVGIAVSAAHVAVDGVEACAVVVGGSVAILLGGEHSVVVEQRRLGPDVVAHADVVEVDDVVAETTDAVAVVKEKVESGIECGAECEGKNSLSERHAAGSDVGTIVTRGDGAGRTHGVAIGVNRGYGAIVTIMFGGTGDAC